MRESNALCVDRYHAVMGNFSLKCDPSGNGKLLGEMPATFYVTQRKLPYAPALGHDRLVNMLNRSRADEPRARFLREDRADLKLIAEKLKHSRFPGVVEAVPEGTIVFSGQPIALVTGPFAMTQMFEVAFEHAFDGPMTWAYQAMRMKQAAGKNIFVSDFSLRRAESTERALEASKYFYIGGLDDTSNMEAAFLYGLDSIGTMAHYLIQSFMALVEKAVKDGLKIPATWYEKGRLKHGQRICFEHWLDAHPNGTVCLVDTISLKLGMIHVIEAALSNPRRARALRAVRIDSGNLAKGIIFARRMLDANGLNQVKIIPTGDLNANKIMAIAEELRDDCLKNNHPVDFKETTLENLQYIMSEIFGIMGFAGGTKIVAEVESVAGVIFKLVKFCGQPTLKLSGTPGKETLADVLQTYRCLNSAGQFVLDVTCPEDEDPPKVGSGDGIVSFIPLIRPFWQNGSSPEGMTPRELRDWRERQTNNFAVPLDQYGRDRVKKSPFLTSLQEEIKRNYLNHPPTNIQIVDEGILEAD